MLDYCLLIVYHAGPTSIQHRVNVTVLVRIYISDFRWDYNSKSIVTSTRHDSSAQYGATVSCQSVLVFVYRLIIVYYILIIIFESLK